MFQKIINWLFCRAYRKNPQSEVLQTSIKNLYQTVKRDEFKLKTEIIKVKKGKTRYAIAFFEDANIKLRANIGRHPHPLKAIDLEHYNIFYNYLKNIKLKK